MSGTSGDLPIVQLLFPMGGLGTRFADTGIKTPKPLIEVDGVPMILKAIKSFERLEGRVDLRPIFIVREEHEKEFGLKTKLAAVVPKAKFAMLDRNTAGAVETCLVAESEIDVNFPIIVMDCDLCFKSSAYEAPLETMTKDGVDGLLLFFESKNNRYSYCELNEDGRTVKRTAEKQVISNCALIGAYGFGTGKAFLEAGKRLVARALDPASGFKEYYVSLLFNFVLEAGGKVVAAPMDEFHSFGTPEELECYKKGERSYRLE